MYAMHVCTERDPYPSLPPSHASVDSQGHERRMKVPPLHTESLGLPRCFPLAAVVLAHLGLQDTSGSTPETWSLP